ncbi:hypothetical protein Tco_0899590 [Tanacetum coccineum]
MAYTSSGSSSSSDSEVDSCSKTCVKAHATLKEQYDSLSSDYKKSQFNLVSYKAVPPPYTGNFIPRKPDLTFIDEIDESENMDVTTVITPSNDKTVKNEGVSNTVESNAVNKMWLLCPPTALTAIATATQMKQITLLMNQPNSPEMSREDLEQIDPDDLEEMNLQWEMAILTIRARRFIERTSRQLDVNGQRVGYDRSKVECYNCHNYETPTENALVAQDGIGGYDWSYQAEEEYHINFPLMAHTSSGSSSSSDSEVDSCSKSCVTAYANLKEQYDSLSSDYKKSQFNLVSYKAGLESVETRLAHYKKNEVVFEESINVLKLKFKLRDTTLVENKKKLEKAEKERDELKLTLEKFQNSSKSLNNLLESQVIDKFKTGLGYNAASSTLASPAVESFVNSSEMLENQENNKSKSDKGYHAVPHRL